MNKRFNVLLSVYNISGYLIAELTELQKYADITVIEVPIAKIPKGNLQEQVKWIDRRTLNVSSVLSNHYDLYLCCGWADKLCLQLAKELHVQGTRTVLMVDTPWQAKVRQFIHCLYSRFYLTTTFDFAWGAGGPQERYLRYLGFPQSRIRRGYYCADISKFAPIGKARFNSNLQLQLQTATPKWPHAFLYIGRYVAVKNMRRMERAFIKAIEQMPESDWTLRCIGGGELWDERTIHPRIEHLGYKTPAEIQEYVKDAGCFVLPSVYEPWGVVVHEAALMGLPMLCSNQIQAATAYLKSGENGYVFNPVSNDDLVDVYLKVMRMANDELAKMGQCSFDFGMSYTTSDWAKIACEFMKG